MTADPIFPFPDPTFLWVHTVTINRQSQVAHDTDERGWSVPAGPVTTNTVRGYVTVPDPRSIGPGDEATAVDVVVLVPRDTVVDPRDTITIPSGQTWTSGTLRITSVRPNPSHIRVLCTRVTDPDGAEA